MVGWEDVYDEQNVMWWGANRIFVACNNGVIDATYRALRVCVDGDVFKAKPIIHIGEKGFW
jgi:hypothetical protein